jgi:hypothetical protein
MSYICGINRRDILWFENEPMNRFKIDDVRGIYIQNIILNFYQSKKLILPFFRSWLFDYYYQIV